MKTKVPYHGCRLSRHIQDRPLHISNSAADHGNRPAPGNTWDSLKLSGKWAERAARHLKAERKRADMTYEELATRLKKHGLTETKASIANKLARRTVPAAFFLAALVAIGAEVVKLETFSGPLRQCEYNVSNAPNNQTGSNTAEGDSNKNATTILGPPAGAVPQHPPSNPENKATKQKRQWTKDPPMFWVTLAGVIAVVAYTSVAAWQASLARGQLDVMTLDQRPWVGAPAAVEFENPFIVDKNGSAKIHAAFTFKNVGRTPTIDTVANFTIVSVREWKDERRKICEADKTTIDPSKWLDHFAIVPNDTIYVERTATIANIRSILAPHLVGCFSYGWRSDNKIHQTGFVGSLKITDDNFITKETIFSIDPD